MLTSKKEVLWKCNGRLIYITGVREAEFQLKFEQSTGIGQMQKTGRIIHSREYIVMGGAGKD